VIPFQDKRKLLPIFQRIESDPALQLDLAMTSLEEAFINIGIDEEKFIEKHRYNT
jgi:ATP-binding cassette subfamily A (ABC1) protein 3